MSHSWSDIEGGYYGNPELSEQIRFAASKQMRFNDVIDKASDFAIGKKAGDSVAFTLFGPIATTSTTALNEYQKLPMKKLARYEGTAVVYRYGVAVGWTGLREDLDRLDVQTPIIHALKRNAAETENQLQYEAAIAGRSFCYVALGAGSTPGTHYNWTTNGTPSGTAATKFTAQHARNVARQMSDVNVPTFDGENYVAVIGTGMYFDIFDDIGTNGFVDVKKYASGGAEGVLEGEFGSYFNTRYVRDNHIVKNNIGSGTAYGEGFFFGGESIKEALVSPFELKANLNLGAGFGEQKAIAWTMIKGYKGGMWDYTTHGQGTIVHYTSA